MRTFELARRLPQWLRIVLAGLLVAFALNSIAHVTHRHDATSAQLTHKLACGYCATFVGLADAPRHYRPLPVPERGGVLIAPAFEVPYFVRLGTSARPRAPPLH
jgi:hypothetical protein